MNNLFKKAVKYFIHNSIGKVPPSSKRLSSPPAIEGGIPVRNTRLRPWPNNRSGNLSDWLWKTGPGLRSIFLNGQEGLPQDLAMQFAKTWAEFNNCQYGLLLPHGTDALRLALAAVLEHDGLDYGGEIIVPNYTFIASATAALDRRFGIALVDVDPGTLLIDPIQVEQAIRPGVTRAILPVHLFGQPVNMDPLRNMARRFDLKIICDAAQAHGALLNTSPVGSLGDISAFSFQSFKNLHCGEGGAITTNNESIFERIYSLHNVGRSFKDDQRWEHVNLGWNCRPTEYQAAILIQRFPRFIHQQAIRSSNFTILRNLLKEEAISCIQPLEIHPNVKQHGMCMFTMRYKPEYCGGIPLEKFIEAVQGEGIPLYRVYTHTIAQQPCIRTLSEKYPDYFHVLPTPVADQAVNDTVYISHEHFLGNDNDMRDIAYALRKIQLHYA